MKIASIYIPRVSRALFVFDFVIVTAILAISSFTLLGVGFARAQSMNGFLLAALIVFIAFFTLICNFAMGLYQRRFLHGRKLVNRSILSAVIGLVAVLFIDNLFLQNSFQFFELAGIYLTIYILIAASRPLLCKVFECYVPKRRLALVGSSTVAEQVRGAILSQSPSDAVLVDHYDCDMKTGHNGLAEMLSSAQNNPDIDEIFVELAAADLVQYQQTGAHHPVNSTLMLFDRYMRWTDNDLMELATCENLSTRGHGSFWVKRIIETLVSFAIVLVFLPVILLTVVAIKLEDGGSIFYRQTRVGKHGKRFSVLKFRSMVENAEAAGAPQWAKVGDSRVTRVGAFLRKSRIDELPQLLTVIKGDMALVGPRPERPEFVEELSKEIANFDLRHVVRPGLTGWAQISYPYGASLDDARWKTRFDLYYINNWTIWFDLAIIMQTIRVVLLAEGSR